MFVYRFKDLSDKYGLYYELSNGVTGMYFLDNIILQFDSKQQEFMVVNRQTASENKKSYRIEEYPEDPAYAKKLSILRQS